MTLFTTKYHPKNSDQIFGQDKGVQELKDFIVNYKTKKNKAALIYGPIGNGKTSSVYALAKELGYDLLEINSSNLRNEASIKEFLGAALGQQSLFFTPKLVLIDEVDNISGVKDRGCIPALLKTITSSTFPVILTANDIEDSKFKPLKKACQLIEYHTLQYRTISHALRWVAEQEGIKIDEVTANTLSRQAGGDLRGALLDFQICSQDGKCTSEDVKSLSPRKRTDTIMNAMTLIFKSSTVDNSLRALDDVDVDLRDVMFWIDENLPREYLDAKSLARAYENISRADVFQGRIRRQQHWRFLVYISNLLTAGVSSAKDSKNPEFVSYRQTMRFLKMWQAKMKLAKKKEIATKLALATHTSHKVAMEQVPYLRQMIQGGTSGIHAELDLSDEEVDWLRK